MLEKIVKNSISNYPNPTINCTVNCYLTEEDKTNDNPCYWIPFRIDLKECISKTQEEIDEMIKTEGLRLFNLEENQVIFMAIEAGINIETPAEVV